jgi:ubiquitin-conjugating enzyme E2 Z
VTAYDAEEEFQANAVDADAHSEPFAPFEPFKDLCKRRFLWYYDSYLSSIEQEAAKHKDDERFEKMPFEGPGNIMEGSFQYSSLKERLQRLHKKLDEESEAWAVEGREAVTKEKSIAVNLQRQFEQIVENYKRSPITTLDLDLVDRNPFVWQLVLFGRPMTNLDGGIFRVIIRISPNFPDVLPRVKFETPLFHHRVSKDGVLCYNPTRKEDMRSHVEAIVEAIEEENPAYDPRTLVNLEAAKLFWGSPEDKKIYNRKLRRSVQDSLE